MGGVATKCSDVTMDKGAGAPKPLDASSTESEEEDEEEDDEEDEDEDDGEDDTKTDAEAALQDGLKRGRTATFKQLITHSRDIGVDEEKILKAEHMLLQHKAQRRREAFESELRDFLEGPEAEDLEACRSYEKKGEEYSVGEKVLEPLRKQIADLNLRKKLNTAEVEEAKLWLEQRTRSFVGSAVKGRNTIWIDMDSGKKLRVVLTLDLIVKYFSVAKQGSEGAVLSTCQVEDVVPKRAFDVEEVASNSAFTDLGDVDQGHAVVLSSSAGHWLFLEETEDLVDEVLAAVTVLSGAGIKDDKAKKGKKKGAAGKAAAEEEMSPVTPRAPKKPPEGEEDAALEAPPESPKKPEKEKKDKKDKKEKKDKKSKKEE